jgi:uncharacterized membrane protein YidH (DUF202 family)
MSYFMKSLTNMMLWTVGLLTAGVAIWQFYLFVVFRDSTGVLDKQGGSLNLWLAVVSAVVACLIAYWGIFRRINKKSEEFHITS